MYTDSFDHPTNAGEKGYPWFFSYVTNARMLSVLVVLFVIGASGGLYIWYSHNGSDPYPDSIPGLAYAVAGTAFLVLAGVVYTFRRRSRKRGIGQLNASLQWHIGFGVMGLALLFMHSFGNFNPRSGTFALYGMIAVVVSGFVGRALDHFMPRLIAREVQKALTAQGEDRIVTISQKLQDIVVHNTEEVRAFDTNTPRRDRVPQLAASTLSGQPVLTSWDLAYISLEETPQELRRQEQQYRFVPDKKSALSRPGALMPGAQVHISALEDVQQALQREQFYRYAILYWRVLHIGLALVTVGLTIWHLEYAAQLLLPIWLHR